MPSVASGALRLSAVACRLAAWALVLLALANALVVSGLRVWFLPLNGIVSDLIPGVVSGLFVFQTPTGGAFRGDFALVALGLLVVDWALCRAASSLR